jgi:hypothetical protein
MNVMLVAASILAPAVATAAHPHGHGPATTPTVVVVPEEVVLATSGVATALERFRTGAVEETAGIDGIIDAVESLTRANAALDGAEQDVVIASAELEYDTAATDLATLMANSDPAVRERIGEATSGWLGSALPRPNAGSDGPTSNCFHEYWDCANWCSELRTFTERSLCGLECYADFQACRAALIRDRRGPGGPIPTVGSSIGGP